MNDPNGLHKDGEGTYHLYYQCPYAFGVRVLKLSNTVFRRQPHWFGGGESDVGSRDKQGSLPLGEPAHRVTPAYRRLASL